MSTVRSGLGVYYRAGAGLRPELSTASLHILDPLIMNEHDLLEEKGKWRISVGRQVRI